MDDSFNRASGEGMRTRPDYGEAAPGSAQAMYKVEEFSKGSGLERTLLDLVRTRVSQVNGRAVCTDVRTEDVAKETCGC